MRKSDGVKGKELDDKKELAVKSTVLKRAISSLRGSLAGSFGIMIAAVTAAGLLNYVFSVIMTRMLPEAGAFSSFNSLNAIYLIVINGAISFQVVVTKYVARFEATGEREKVHVLIRSFSRWLLLAGGAVILVSIPISWPLADVLRLDSPVFVIILGTSVALALYVTLPYGLLQGEQKFIGLGAVGISAAALRVVVGIALVGIGLQVYGALSAATIAGVIVAGAVVYYYRDIFRGPVERLEDFHPAQALWFLLPVAAATFLVILMTQIDIVLVRALFKDPRQADIYSYAALAGKAVMFFPDGILAVMFPRVSALRAGGEPTRRVLALSIIAVSVMVGAVAGFYLLFPSFTGYFFAGTKGRASAGIIGLFGIVMAVFALVKLLAMYHLALERKSFIILFAVAAALEITGIMLFHDTLKQVLFVMLFVGTALLALNLVLAFREKPGKPTEELEELEEYYIPPVEG
jgi:O-antigen/teichoic acid export membrane protein